MSWWSGRKRENIYVPVFFQDQSSAEALQYLWGIGPREVTPTSGKTSFQNRETCSTNTVFVLCSLGPYKSLWAPLQCRKVIPKKFQELALKVRAAALQGNPRRKSERRKKMPTSSHKRAHTAQEAAEGEALPRLGGWVGGERGGVKENLRAEGKSPALYS